MPRWIYSTRKIEWVSNRYTAYRNSSVGQIIFDLADSVRAVMNDTRDQRGLRPAFGDRLVNMRQGSCAAAGDHWDIH